MASDRSQLFGGKLGSSFPATTTAQTAFTALAVTEITRIQVCNITAGSAYFSIYHDDSGSTYGTATALVFGKLISGNGTEVLEAASQGSGITVRAGGTIGVQTASANHCNFTIYGIVQQVR